MAGREDLGLGVENGGGRHHARAGALGDVAERLFVHVGDHQPGAGRVQLVGQVGAHVAHALDGDGDAVEVAVQRPADAQGDTAEHAFGSHRAGIARGRVVAGQACDITGGLARVHQVGGRDAHVFGRPVLARDVLDRATEGLEQRWRLLGAGIADDHGLAAPQVQVGHGVLVGHGAREPQSVLERRLGGRERPHAAAAGGGPSGGGMHGDDAFQAGFFVEEGVDAFMALEGGGIEQGHAADIAMLGKELRLPLRLLRSPHNPAAT
jgi:hypothetical protein